MLYSSVYKGWGLGVECRILDVGWVAEFFVVFSRDLQPKVIYEGQEFGFQASGCWA